MVTLQQVQDDIVSAYDLLKRCQAEPVEAYFYKTVFKTSETLSISSTVLK